MTAEAARLRGHPSVVSFGVVHGMPNSGWTSLHWRLFDRYLDQGGAYFGAKKANEPRHIPYSYDSREVVVVNNRHDAATGLTARVGLYDTKGARKYARRATALTAPDGTATTTVTRAADTGGSAPSVRGSGWNTTTRTVAANRVS